MVLRSLAIVALLAGLAAADSSATLRDANAAAAAGDWARVRLLVDPLLAASSAASPADLGEADRLEGLAAFFTNQKGSAEWYFVAYLKHDHEGRLDPALYTPEVVNFFNDVRARHAAELVVKGPPPKRYWALALLPPVAQFQNGDRVKGIILASGLGALLATNVTTWVLLRSWCHDTGSTCDASGKNHYRTAETLSGLNISSGIVFIGLFAYGVWDGVRGYRAHSRELEFQPYVSSSSESTSFGVTGHF